MTKVNYLIVKVKHEGDIQEINETVDYVFKHKDISETEIVGIQDQHPDTICCVAPSGTDYM
jgi:hypothetical protein